ncbi:MAG TPA: type II toxin-antitoxin system prevent-host-death family antitoxin [Pseudomonadales bacterium]|nr:type II toxin-antitoxin system prevent-host-death family antitoxin [Pseudomonadales bacterium]
MRKVNMHEAKTTLSQLVQAVEDGERVVLARAGRPVVELVPVAARQGVKLGGLKGKISARVLRDMARPLSKDELESLIGGALVP